MVDFEFYEERFDFVFDLLVGFYESFIMHRQGGKFIVFQSWSDTWTRLEFVNLWKLQ